MSETDKEQTNQPTNEEALSKYERFLVNNCNRFGCPKSYTDRVLRCARSKKISPKIKAFTLGTSSALLIGTIETCKKAFSSNKEPVHSAQSQVPEHQARKSEEKTRVSPLQASQILDSARPIERQVCTADSIKNVMKNDAMRAGQQAQKLIYKEKRVSPKSISQQRLPNRGISR